MEFDAISDTKVKAILARATWGAPFKIDAIRVCRNQGEAIRAKIDRTRRHHAQVRANIIAQATENNKAVTSTAPRSTDPLSEEAASALVKKLQKPWTRHKSQHTGHGPKKINELYTKTLPIAQRRPMHPTLRNLVEVVKALERYNEYARQQLRNLEEEKQTLDVSGKSKEKILTVSAKFPQKKATDTQPSPGASVASLPMPGMAQLPANLKGGSVVDRSRDPRLQGRTVG